MEKIKLNFALVCDYAFFAEGNKPSIVGIFKTINAFVFPYTHPVMYIVVNLTAPEVTKYKIVIDLIDEEKKVTILQAPFSFEITANTINSEIGILAQLINTKFEKDGKYFFTIKVNDTDVEKIPILVNKINQ